MTVNHNRQQQLLAIMEAGTSHQPKEVTVKHMPRVKDSAWQYFDDNGFERMKVLLPNHVHFYLRGEERAWSPQFVQVDGLICVVLHQDFYSADRTAVDALLDVCNEFPHMQFYVLPVNIMQFLALFTLETKLTPQESDKSRYFVFRNAQHVAGGVLDDTAEQVKTALGNFYTTHRGFNDARVCFLDKVRQVCSTLSVSPDQAVNLLKSANKGEQCGCHVHSGVAARLPRAKSVLHHNQ